LYVPVLGNVRCSVPVERWVMAVTVDGPVLKVTLCALAPFQFQVTVPPVRMSTVGGVNALSVIVTTSDVGKVCVTFVMVIAAVVAVFVSEVAVTVAEPGARPLNVTLLPVPVTESIVGWLLTHAIVRPVSVFPDASFRVAVRVAVCWRFREAGADDSVTVATGAGGGGFVPPSLPPPPQAAEESTRAEAHKKAMRMGRSSPERRYSE
jgi:hypothetical protein